jgi:hypothetical protein
MDSVLALGRDPARGSIQPSGNFGDAGAENLKQRAKCDGEEK